jgi:hypothetical protein
MIAPVFVIFSAAVFTHYPQRVRVIVKNVCKKRITLPFALCLLPLCPFAADAATLPTISTQVPPNTAKRLFGTF